MGCQLHSVSLVWSVGDRDNEPGETRPEGERAGERPYCAAILDPFICLPQIKQIPRDWQGESEPDRVVVRTLPGADTGDQALFAYQANMGIFALTSESTILNLMDLGTLPRKR